MRQGIYKAIQSEYKNIIVEGDNKIPIQAARAEIRVPWVINTLVQDIQILPQQAACSQVQHV